MALPQPSPDPTTTDPNRLSPPPAIEAEQSPSSSSSSGVNIPPTPETNGNRGSQASRKRSRTQLENPPVEPTTSTTQRPVLRKRPHFLRPPLRNGHVLRLERHLQHHDLFLRVEPPPSQHEMVYKTYHRIVSYTGLVVNEWVRIHSQVPVLRFLLPDELTAAPIGRVSRGALLADCWSELTPETKRQVVDSLRGVVNKMRRTLPPAQLQGYPIVGSVITEGYSLLLQKGAGTTYWAIRQRPRAAHFTAFMLSNLRPGLPEAVADSIASQISRTSPLVLSHGELSPSNIVVLNGSVVAILGWDCGGWYPDWWDYVNFFEAHVDHRNRDWFDYASDIFDDMYTNELVAFQAILRNQTPR
ncbi:hypothetical protein L249_1216 [Ophiocordyceps polyrhachis-furcata BCC 54312]|uniref:Aminoglycoside phosphotransferase domain-containing protein n=1 Tax=Ophiocordyceps polyrhachis-furcata BCC 54312 TaxID=1330021 RepID=A0A367LDS7_9HYPO|nr:hypothetical protein L249_1216 [Ophiocordyceps polyrhachis-furcata BCC 54312]